MILDAHFDRIAIISLPRSPERGEASLRELREKGLSAKAELFRGIDGKLCPPSDWWVAGSGAWGCMMSHFRLVQDALMDGVESLLVLEDDCVWQNDAAMLAAEFLPQVPGDWGQIYLGGQHRSPQRPAALRGKPAVWRPRSVHRTHAYAIHRRAMQKFLKHVIYAPDYIETKKRSGVKRHVDHQLEHAQQRGDWPVYCPSWWLAGQGENVSLINGRSQREQWWQLGWQEEHRRLPLVVVGRREPTAAELRCLHFGNNLLEGSATVDTGVRDAANADVLMAIMLKIASQALGGQRLPALLHPSGKDLRIKQVVAKWAGPVIQLGSKTDLATLCNYPRNRAMVHPWLNPRPGGSV
jgi:hypothetical protein